MTNKVGKGTAHTEMMQLTFFVPKKENGKLLTKQKERESKRGGNIGEGGRRSGGRGRRKKGKREFSEERKKSEKRRGERKRKR